MALWHNRLQEMAAGTRLGIPVTVSTDPRHAFTDNPGTAMLAGAFSRWPEATGLAAIGDADLVRRYADVVRREYLAVGIRVALHPQIDLATEPRWSRISGTFGADAGLTSRLVTAYLEGMRGPGPGAEAVACMVKHFPGGGPQKDGEDPHFAYGKEQVYPGGNFDYHLEPFRAAVAAGATQIMPYYGVPVGTPTRRWASASTSRSSPACSARSSASTASSAPTGSCSTTPASAPTAWRPRPGAWSTSPRPSARSRRSRRGLTSSAARPARS
nr:hypothetical protein GCM10020093_113090 [Planobispora longispora]